MPPKKVTEEPDDSQTWELLERCLLPIAFSHAVAVIISTVLNTLGISQTSSFVLFLLFLSLSIGFTLFYHNLKVTAPGKAVLVTGCDSRVGCALAKRLDELAALEAWGSCLRLEMRRWGVDVVVVETGEYVAGNSWLKDNSALLNQARDMWVQLEPQTRKEYGEELFQKEMLSLEKYTKGPEADLTRVMRALVDGTTKTFPLKRYTPVTRKERLQAFVSDHLPKSIYDIIYTD
ncbi:hypothetical protein G9C98_002614 [Cotesia typhae]|uniref:Uncharacterized protein n=1 Tax=Cotesia typhae TaxID=2053667 RepID=A0A8J5QTH2_9HYME|nr:hypothetical protein G9C98_002614 [Cotesia typhae]